MVQFSKHFSDKNINYLLETDEFDAMCLKEDVDSVKK